MDSIKIKKRTKKVITAIQREWSEYWLKFIIDNPYKDWDWNWISNNPNLTMQIINANPDKPWHWDYISCNPNITMEIINDNPDKPWDWLYISLNPTITIKDINDNPEKHWDWFSISRNIFIKEKKAFVEKMYRRHLAAILIQNAYKNALVNPNCHIGLNKIERDMVFAGI